MANNTQRSRLSGYTGMTNGNHSTQSSFGTLFGAPLSSSSPWGNNATTSFANNRDTITPRDAINGGASALRGTSTNGAWRAWGAAADSSQARPLSGNTSPRSRSDASSHDMNGGSIFFSAGPSTVTQGAASGSRPATTTTSALEPSSGTFQHHSGFADYADEGDDEQFMTQELDRGFPTFATAAQRQAQDPSALNAVGTGAARRSLSSRGQSDLTFSDFPYGASAGPSNHSQRPSLAGSSFPTQNAMNFDHNAGRQSNAGLVGDAFARMALNDNSNGAASGLGSGPSYGNGAQNFQFNPVTQPWDAGQGYGNGFARDTYGNGMGHEHRGSIVGRNSPAGSTYLAGNGLNSPRSFTGTPQPSADAWPTPASRDPRLALELERRGLVSPFVQQAPNAYFPNAFFPQNYTQFPYGAYGDPRNPAHMAGYGMPIPPYALGGAIPTRPARDQDPGRAYRSALLQEFKNSPKSRRWELKDIWGHIVEFCGDQQGSRFIQSKLETANSEEKARVFAEIEPNAIPLMEDVFGNYVLQKLFEYGDQVQKKKLANAMKGKVVALSMQNYACRVVQKALHHVLVEQQEELAKELEPKLIETSKDQHGNHVVQAVIELVPRERIDFVMAGLKGHVCELASQQFGCRVIQRVLEHGSEADKASMMQELHNGAEALVTDPYGNYVVQHVLTNGKPEDRSRMIEVVIPQLLNLSRHKNASNVVEKCILFGTPQEQRAILDRLLAKADETNSLLFQLMKDQFGNYVIQKLITALHGKEKAMVVEKVASYIPALKKSGTPGRQIDTLERLVRENQTPPAPASASANTSSIPTPASSAPTSPGLHVDINSAAPTPNLTMDPNSPLSSPSSNHPPYLSGNAIAEIPVVDRTNGQVVGDKESDWEDVED